MITNRHITRVLNEILDTYCKRPHVLYGVDDTLIIKGVITREQDVLLSDLSYKGLDVMEIIICAGNLSITVILTPND